ARRHRSRRAGRDLPAGLSPCCGAGRVRAVRNPGPGRSIRPADGPSRPRTTRTTRTRTARSGVARTRPARSGVARTRTGRRPRTGRLLTTAGAAAGAAAVRAGAESRGRAVRAVARQEGEIRAEGIRETRQEMLALFRGAQRRAPDDTGIGIGGHRSEEHTSELQSREKLVCRLLPEK